MDPLAHTLFGACLAETGLKKVSPLATATLLLGANAPDIDIVSRLGGIDAALYWRRGHTHGVLAMLVLPAAITGLMLLWDRWVRRRRAPDAPPTRPGVLFALALLAVLTHPLLDWLNTYGVRVLMPFDDRWFYGDALYIMDPWVWLLAGASVVVARSHGRLPAAMFLVLGCTATAVVMLVPFVPTGAQIAWLAGVGGIVALRLSGRARELGPSVARAGLAAIALYIGITVAGSHAAHADAVERLQATRGMAVDVAVPNPIPGDPLAREVILRSGDAYHFVERRWAGSLAWRSRREPMPTHPRDRVVEAALAAPRVRGMRGWLRLPRFAVEETSDGFVVTIEDVRYHGTPTTIGQAVVHLDRQLKPR
jgi:inner membrane protein